MATNKKKIFITESMSEQGRALLKARDDIEIVEFPNMISASDFEAMLAAQAPVHGVALGATRFGEPELEASRDMKVVTRIGVGYDAVDVPALSRRKVPLMTAGTANSPSVAEQALFMMLTLAKRAVEMHGIVRDNKWAARLGMLPYDLFGKTVLIRYAVAFMRLSRAALNMPTVSGVFGQWMLTKSAFGKAASRSVTGSQPAALISAAVL